jgi:predicted DNA repair protein MutK
MEEVKTDTTIIETTAANKEQSLKRTNRLQASHITATVILHFASLPLIPHLGRIIIALIAILWTLVNYGFAVRFRKDHDNGESITESERARQGFVCFFVAWWVLAMTGFIDVISHVDMTAQEMRSITFFSYYGYIGIGYSLALLWVLLGLFSVLSSSLIVTFRFSLVKSAISNFQ